MSTHKDCINYLNGRCTLYNIPVDPNGPACPEFRPKTVVTNYPNKFLTPYPPQSIGPGWGRGLRRRWRHRRRHRRGRRFFFL